MSTSEGAPAASLGTPQGTTGDSRCSAAAAAATPNIDGWNAFFMDGQKSSSPVEDDEDQFGMTFSVPSESQCQRGPKDKQRTDHRWTTAVLVGPCTEVKNLLGEAAASGTAAGISNRRLIRDRYVSSTTNASGVTSYEVLNGSALVVAQGAAAPGAASPGSSQRDSNQNSPSVLEQDHNHYNKSHHHQRILHIDPAEYSTSVEFPCDGVSSMDSVSQVNARVVSPVEKERWEQEKEALHAKIERLEREQAVLKGNYHASAGEPKMNPNLKSLIELRRGSVCVGSNNNCGVATRPHGAVQLDQLRRGSFSIDTRRPSVTEGINHASLAALRKLGCKPPRGPPVEKGMTPRAAVEQQMGNPMPKGVLTSMAANLGSAAMNSNLAKLFATGPPQKRTLAASASVRTLKTLQQESAAGSAYTGPGTPRGRKAARSSAASETDDGCGVPEPHRLPAMNTNPEDTSPSGPGRSCAERRREPPDLADYTPAAPGPPPAIPLGGSASFKPRSRVPQSFQTQGRGVEQNQNQNLQPSDLLNMSPRSRAALLAARRPSVSITDLRRPSISLIDARRPSVCGRLVTQLQASRSQAMAPAKAEGVASRSPQVEAEGRGGNACKGNCDSRGEDKEVVEEGLATICGRVVLLNGIERGALPAGDAESKDSGWLAGGWSEQTVALGCGDDRNDSDRDDPNKARTKVHLTFDQCEEKLRECPPRSVFQNRRLVLLLFLDLADKGVEENELAAFGGLVTRAREISHGRAPLFVVGFVGDGGKSGFPEQAMENAALFAAEYHAAFLDWSKGHIADHRERLLQHVGEQVFLQHALGSGERRSNELGRLRNTPPLLQKPFEACATQ